MNKELFRLWLTKLIVSIFGKGTSHRIVRFFYNNLASNTKGFLINVAYLEEMEILINTKDIIGWKLFFFGEYEFSTNNILRKIVHNNQVVIEAGANVGSETLLLSKLNPNGKIYAFEPAPIPFDLLRFNIANNKLNNVELFQKALGGANGQLKLHLLPNNFPNQGLSSVKKHSRSVESIHVPLTTVDSFVDEFQIERLDLLKMDVQGAELFILKGGVESLREFRPKILLEATSEFLDLVEVFNFLKNLGYSVYAYDQKYVKQISSMNILEGNWLCIHKDYPMKESQIFK